MKYQSADMVFQILKQPEESRDQPLLNEAGRWSMDDMQRYISQKIMLQIKKTPELIGMFDTLVTDHFQGEVDLFTVDGKPLGPTLKKKYELLWESEKIDDAFYGMGIDLFSDGSSFGWTGSAWDGMTLKQKETLKTLDQAYSGGIISMNAVQYAKKPKKIWYLPASTVEIIHDDYGVTAYKQETSGKTIFWDPEQVVHVKLMEMDGKTRSYSGMKALTMEVALMYMIKENLLAKMQNGGSPDNIIFLKNANGISKARFQRLRVALESFSHLRKSHGNMPIDADVGAIPLGASIKDMEYKELAMFVVSEFCLALGLPTSRVPFLMTGSGGVSNKGELSSNSEDSYQKKVNNRRRKFAARWNYQFRKMGFTFKFRTDNLQDDVREVQAAVQRGTYVQSIQSTLTQRGKQLTEYALTQLLSGNKRNIDLEDIEDLDMSANPYMQDQGVGNNNSSSFTNNDMKGRISQDRSDAKTATAKNNGATV